MVDVEDDDRGDGGEGHQDTGEEEVLADHGGDYGRARDQVHEEELEDAERKHDGDAYTDALSAVAWEVEGQNGEHVD